MYFCLILFCVVCDASILYGINIVISIHIDRRIAINFFIVFSISIPCFLNTVYNYIFIISRLCFIFSLTLTFSQLMDLQLSGIPIIYDMILDDDSLILIEEYIHGQTLEQLLNDQNTLIYSDALSIMKNGI